MLPCPHAAPPARCPRGRAGARVAGGRRGGRVLEPGPPDHGHAPRRPRGAGARARRRLDPRRRGGRPSGDRAPAPGRRARRRGAVARAHGEPRRRGARHPPERARRRPQPQLPAPLARRRAPIRHLLPRPVALVGARDRRRARAGAPRAPRHHGLLPPAHAPGEPLAGGRPRARARLRSPRRAAGAHAARLPRHRDELAEPRAQRHERVRGRAPGRLAARGLGAPSRGRAAGRRRGTAQRRCRRSAAAAHRLEEDPVRRATGAC